MLIARCEHLLPIFLQKKRQDVRQEDGIKDSPAAISRISIRSYRSCSITSGLSAVACLSASDDTSVPSTWKPLSAKRDCSGRTRSPVRGLTQRHSRREKAERVPRKDTADRPIVCLLHNVYPNSFLPYSSASPLSLFAADLHRYPPSFFIHSTRSECCLHFFFKQMSIFSKVLLFPKDVE